MKRADSISFKEKTRLFLAVPAALLMIVGAAGCGSALKKTGAASTLESRDQIPLTDATSRTSDSAFSTFNETGQALCTDEGELPLILLFSASSCPHCQWVGGAFDMVAGEYAGRGLVAAHHYDVETGDDLLTETVETKVPEAHLKIGKRGDPEGYLPYFNFGCRFERIGTGYEEQDDLAAEAEEMSRVIEALLP